MKLELMELPFDPGALEPHLSAQTIQFHHGKHHAGYVDKVNRLVDGTGWSQRSLEEIIRSAADQVLHDNAAQVWNHDLYWQSIDTSGEGEPDPVTRDAIVQSFGSLDDFRRELAEAAKSHFASGWAWLVKDQSRKLQIVTTSDAVNPLENNQVPLLAIDLWEHAHYLDYQNRRADYVDTFVAHLINWDCIGGRL